ncbi:MAG: hypothetical protein R2828_22740 [Saprospiraceae bacterium]
MELFIEIIGWLGSILLIGAFLLNSMNKLDTQSLQYQLMNLLGGVMLIMNSFYYGALPSSFLNLIWSAIAVFYLGLIVVRNRKLTTGVQ